MNKTLEDEFKFYIPLDIKKSKNGKTAEMILEGLAGDGTSDTDGESLTYNGFNLDRMFYINWEHSKEPGDVIGVILLKELRKGGKLFIKGKLFNDHQKAKDAYQLQEFLEKEGHNLGFSVEGKVIERDPINPKVVRKAELYGVALCKVPVNPLTYAKISKAFQSGESVEEDDEEDEDDEDVEKMTTGDMAPTMPESVEKKKKIVDNTPLTKSEVYIKIFNRFTKEPELSDKIYNLIKSISIKSMENGQEKAEITEDVILKAQQILGLAKAEEPKKEEKVGGEIKKGSDQMKVQGEENGGDISVLQKAMQDAHDDYVKKAEAYKSLCKAKGIDPEVPQENISKAFDYDLIKGAIAESISEKLSGLEKIEKSIEVRTQALGSLINADRENIDSLKADLQKANEAIQLSNDSLAKAAEFNEDFRERLNIVERTPIRKAVTTENFKERFQGGEGNGKSSGTQYNVNSMKDREALAKSVEAAYGSDLENPENNKMMQAAATLQMTGLVDPDQQALLKSKGFELVQM